MHSTQRTLPVTWLVNVERISSAELTARPAKLLTTVQRGVCSAVSAKTAASLSCAVCMRRL